MQDDYPGCQHSPKPSTAYCIGKASRRGRQEASSAGKYYANEPNKAMKILTQTSSISHCW